MLGDAPSRMDKEGMILRQGIIWESRDGAGISGWVIGKSNASRLKGGLQGVGAQGGDTWSQGIGGTW